jgi:hypothetical protein
MHIRGFEESTKSPGRSSSVTTSEWLLLGRWIPPPSSRGALGRGACGRANRRGGRCTEYRAEKLR